MNRCFLKWPTANWRLLLLAIQIAQTATAHQQPATLVMLDVGSSQVGMRLRIPLSELELAFGHGVTREPEKRISVWRPNFKDYLLQHIREGSDHLLFLLVLLLPASLSVNAGR